MIDLCVSQTATSPSPTIHNSFSIFRFKQVTRFKIDVLHFSLSTNDHFPTSYSVIEHILFLVNSRSFRSLSLPIYRTNDNIYRHHHVSKLFLQLYLSLTTTSDTVGLSFTSPTSSKQTRWFVLFDDSQRVIDSIDIDSGGRIIIGRSSSICIYKDRLLVFFFLFEWRLFLRSQS